MPIKMMIGMISEEKIHQIFQKMDLSILNTSLLGKGEASVVYKITTNKGIYALKTALYPKRKKKVLREAEIRKFFIEKGMTCIPHPILADDTIFQNGAVIYEFIEGNKPNFSDIEIIKQFAQITSMIHQIEYEIIEDGFSNIKKLYSSLEKITNKITTSFPHLMNQLIESAFNLGIKEFNEM